MKKAPSRTTIGNHATSKKKKGAYFQSGYAYLACDIGPTRFEDERAVYIKRLDGGSTVAIVDPGEVNPSGPVEKITPGEAVVRVVSRIEGGFLIDPPGESINSAGRVPVPEKIIRFP